jgi:hypothetical protein
MDTVATIRPLCSAAATITKCSTVKWQAAAVTLSLSLTVDIFRKFAVIRRQYATVIIVYLVFLEIRTLYFKAGYKQYNLLKSIY